MPGRIGSKCVHLYVTTIPALFLSLARLDENGSRNRTNILGTHCKVKSLIVPLMQVKVVTELGFRGL